MYERWARKAGLASERLEERGTGKQVRFCVLRLEGRGVEALLGEGGAHSIQHKTRSRRQDRIHTSTVTVAVFDAGELAERAGQMLNAGEVRVDTFRGHGAGGQHRNVTDSAVRAVHTPTGETATVTSGRSQHENRQAALELLAARLQARQNQSRVQRVQGKRREQTRAERARADRVYDLVRDVVRCGRTGRKVRGVRRVLRGDLDPLLG